MPTTRPSGYREVEKLATAIMQMDRTGRRMAMPSLLRLLEDTILEGGDNDHQPVSEEMPGSPTETPQ
jgi:hypothetical protein